jgi:hypothetical protein
MLLRRVEVVILDELSCLEGCGQAVDSAESARGQIERMDGQAVSLEL